MDERRDWVGAAALLHQSRVYGGILDQAPAVALVLATDDCRDRTDEIAGTDLLRPIRGAEVVGEYAFVGVSANELRGKGRFPSAGIALDQQTRPIGGQPGFDALEQPLAPDEVAVAKQEFVIHVQRPNAADVLDIQIVELPRQRALDRLPHLLEAFAIGFLGSRPFRKVDFP